jgi:uncharacterized DUF497 family protein
MIITWDEPKRRANIAEHRMDFADLDQAFFEAAAYRRAHSRRLLAVGVISNQTIAVLRYSWKRRHQHHQHASCQ